MKKKSISNSKLRRKSSVKKDKPVTPNIETDINKVQSTTSDDRSSAVTTTSDDIHAADSVTSIDKPSDDRSSISGNTHLVSKSNNNPQRVQWQSDIPTLNLAFPCPGTSPSVVDGIHHPLSIETPPGTSSVATDEYDLPSTQLIDNRILKNVLAYVEVRSTNDNRSEAIRKELEQLGAAVTKKFTDDVTHVIFKEGSKRTKNKATKNKIHLISVLWVDSCKQYQEHVSERLYPAVVPATDKGTPLFIAKLKKAKSMQPSNFDDEVANSAERCNKRKQKLVDRLQSSDNTPQNSPSLGRILVHETQPRTPVDINTPIRLLIPDTPPSMREKMMKLKSKGSADTPVRENEDEEPLQRRLFSGMPSASFDSNDVDHLVDNLQDEINKCIENMPESPLPCGLSGQAKSSPTIPCDKNRSSPCQRIVTTIPIVKPTIRKSPKANKRRKSIATVKFVDDDIKPKRTSNRRRKSVAIFTPTKIYEELEPVVTSESNKVSEGNKMENCPTDLQNMNNNADLKNDSMMNDQSKNNVKGKRISKRMSILKSTIDNDSAIKLQADEMILKVQNTITTTANETIKVTCTSVNDINNKDPSESAVSSDKANKSAKKGPQRSNSKKKLLPLSDMDPALPLLSRTPDAQTPTQGRKRKLASDSSISALFPNQSSIQKRQRKNSHVEKTEKNNTHENTITSNTISSTDVPMTNDLTLQETTVNSSTATQNDNSMSAVFGDSVLTTLTGRYQTRPSIDEFNLRKGVKQMTRHKTVSSSSLGHSDSDSSDNCQSKKTYRKSPPSRPSLAMTSLHAEEQDVVISVVKKLGNFVITDNVTESTTHLICGSPRRTLNALYGIMRGIWIVHKQWVLSSLEAMTWLPEGDYEVTDYFPVAKITDAKCHTLLIFGQYMHHGTNAAAMDYKVTREGRHLHKENYQSLSLSSVGTIYLAQKTSPPRHHLLNLLRLCGAKVINNQNKADIYMGHEFVPDKTCINPVWVLDCITQQQQLDVDRYLLGRPKRESSPEF